MRGLEMTRILKMPPGLCYPQHWARHLSQDLDQQFHFFLSAGHLENMLEACRAPSDWHCLHPSCRRGQLKRWDMERDDLRFPQTYWIQEKGKALCSLSKVPCRPLLWSPTTLQRMNISRVLGLLKMLPRVKAAGLVVPLR